MGAAAAPHQPPAPEGGVGELLDEEWYDIGVLADDDGLPLGTDAGVLTFADDVWEVTAGLERRQVVVPVFRQNGTVGAVSCKYRLEAHTAVPGYDFVECEGELHFMPGVARADIHVELLPKRLGEHSDQFRIVLEDVEGGATFYPYSDGGEERCLLTVTIYNEHDKLVTQSLALRASRCIDGVVNLDSFRRGTGDWYKEVADSLFDVGGDEDGEGPSRSDWAMHMLSIPWKFVFAVLVPPTAFIGGWLCFVLSLVYIGGITVLVIDFAELFGCVTGIEDSITAITFVALGTSMPDLFASVCAARGDAWADASIVNVTGSNSVNVFVGIGLPWTMAAIYWAVQGPTAGWIAKYGSIASIYPGGGFVVRGGDLAFGVVVFTVAALVALALLWFRRVKLGGELGGPFGPKVLSSLVLVLLWLFYITLSIWKVVTKTQGVWSQVLAICVGIAVLEHVLMVAGLVLYACKGSKAPESVEDLEDDKLPPLPPPASGLAPAHYPHVFRDAKPAAVQHSEALRSTGLADGAARQLPLAPGGRPPQFHSGFVDGSPIVTAECLFGNAVSFTGAAMVCLAAKRFQRGARKGQGAALQRAPSFHSLESAPVSSSGAAPSRPGVVQSVGGRVAGWVGDHTADCVALSVAGLAAAQLANRQLC